ncbi:hypothetical protein [Lysobacter sp. cf310]|uniref:hypothetical protein n=1 Tax=Lysobacter sp. cf310 TaxID=1761790 RepID=UPI0008F15552|nr:hypothetical protein [Lysobacter sp. cf310]SFL32050.1 hypothetical protein SAMN04487938_4146 [Lysobacter sp. cf310]
MSKPLNLSWGRFALAMGVLNSLPLLLALASGGLDTGIMIAWLMVLSLSVFSIFGWSRLRRANAVAPLSAFDADRFRRVLIGPPAAAIVWWVCTVAVAIGLAIITAL